MKRSEQSPILLFGICPSQQCRHRFGQPFISIARFSCIFVSIGSEASLLCGRKVMFRHPAERVHGKGVRKEDLAGRPVLSEFYLFFRRKLQKFRVGEEVFQEFYGP